MRPGNLQNFGDGDWTMGDVLERRARKYVKPHHHWARHVPGGFAGTTPSNLGERQGCTYWEKKFWPDVCANLTNPVHPPAVHGLNGLGDCTAIQKRVSPWDCP
jgi:hypothetical protein